jgi:hypothetical protein
MDVEQILSVHKAQDPRCALAVGVVRKMLADCAKVDGQEFVDTKSAVLKREARTSAEQALVQELTRLEAAIDHETETAIARAQETERQRLTAVNGKVQIEIARLDAASVPAEVSVILGEAESLGSSELRRVWQFARPKLELMSREDIRRHRLSGGGGAFAILMKWSTRLAELGRTAPNESELRARARNEKSALKARIKAIADLGGLDGFKRALVVAAATPSGVKANITFGKFRESQQRS